MSHAMPRCRKGRTLPAERRTTESPRLALEATNMEDAYYTTAYILQYYMV
jgi:hypothetical protein